MKHRIVPITLGAIGVCLLALGLYGSWIAPEEQPVSGGWVRSSECGPPAGEPFVGFWVDAGQPVVVAVREAAGQYFEYDALHPRGPAALLFGYPPIWWTRMPGGAE